ncbi:MAG: hypothetical protein ACE5J4_02325 [Candidatus Aenigmatarchaeota archaeon]
MSVPRKIFGNRISLVSIGLMILHFIVGLWNDFVNLFKSFSLQNLLNILIRFGMLLFSSQEIMSEAIITIRSGGLTVWEIFGNLELIFGSMLVTIFLIWIVWKFAMWAKGEVQWDRVSKFILFMGIFLAIGFLGALATYVSTGKIVAPYHGFIELFRW